MAKIRRIIRKTRQPNEPAFDEQFWPVMLALFVLGGFLMGSVLAYLPLNEGPWFANAWTWLFVIPAVVCGAITMLRRVNNQALRRGVQFSAVICVIVHLIMFLISIETNIFSRFWEEFTQLAEARRQREPIVEPIYDPVQLEPQQRQQQNFLRPVETETPDPEMEELEQEEREPEPPTERQPTPTPEREVTVNPNIVQRPTPAETVPRQAEQLSRLSRQTPTSQPRSQERVSTSQPTSEPSAQRSALASQSSDLQRRTTESQAERAPEMPDATARAEQPTLQQARRTEQTRPDPATASVATMQRRVATPRNVPRTQVDSANQPNVAQQTRPEEMRPNNTLARSQATAAPQAERTATQPTPSPAPNVQAQATRREQQADPQPNVAQTPVTVPNQRSRTTSRPDVATMANVATPSTTPSSQANPNVEATSAAMARSASTAQPQRQATTAEPTTNPTTQAVASTTRRQSQQSPTTVANATTPSPISRQTTNASVAPATAVAATQASAASATSQTAEITPSASAPRRQAVTSPQVAMSAGSPSSRSAPDSTPSVTAAATNRQQRAVAVPTISQATSVASSGRSTSRSQPTTASTTADQASEATQAASSGNASAVAAAASGVGRQTPTAAAATADDAGTGGPQISPSAQSVATNRAAMSSVPTINSSAAASSSPTRSARAAEVASSPTSVASPATAQGSSGEATPTPQATRIAMTRSLEGVSGVGQSANLDRALEAGESPSLVASGAARRARATQNTPEGPALSPSEPALVRQTLAGADRPSASIRATTTEAAAVAGAERPAAATASASGSLTRASSNAETGAITAAAGNVQVDLGPTRVVSGSASSRAAGGGQPELNLSSEAQQLARSNSGGSAQPTLAATVAAEVAAPAGMGGGQPTPQGLAPVLAEIGRGAPAPAEVETGQAGAPGSEPTDEPAETGGLAGGTPTRAQGGPAVPEVAALSGDAGDEEDEEERARRIARQAMGGAPQLAVTADLVPGAMTAPSGERGQSEAEAGTQPAVAQLARSEPGGAAPASSAEAASSNGPDVAASGGEVAGPTVVRRAEAADAFTGMPKPGGGTGSPQRAAPRRDFVANVEAPTVAMAGAPNSGGTDSGVPSDTLGARASELTGGPLGRPTNPTAGAEAGSRILEGVAASGSSAGPANQLRSTISADGPSVGEEATSATPVPRSSAGPVNLGRVAAAPIDLPAAPSSVALAQADTSELGIGSELSPMTRQSSSAVPVEIEALEGPSGLGSEQAADVGLNTRRARPDSLQIPPREMRFVRQEIGGQPDFNTAAVMSTEAFRRRNSRTPGESPGAGRPAPGAQTDKAIELGLAYLARHQLADGSWSLQSADERAMLVSDTAATGLALLAFQGYGHTHHENNYATVVGRGLDYLIKNQKESGDLFVTADDQSNRSVRLYSHGIAAIALCEAYGMTQDPALREPAQRAIDFIVASQHKEYGGWRYTPNFESDTSVTGWMMMALKSGELANLEVPSETYVKIERWLDLAQGARSERHLYRYNPYAPDNNKQRHGRRTSTTMTAVGLLMRFYTGWKRDNDNMVRGADYLLENSPAIGTVRDPKRDTYYWYYATQVMFHMGGETWQKWDDKLRPLLIDTQLESGPNAGSWDPRTPVPDRWAPHAGRLYVTTMNLLSLEVHYRHLPLYEETAR
jgi:hypothetical protein